MVILSQNDVESLKRAKQNRNKHFYRTVYYKSADSTYRNLQAKLAKQYGCSVSEIQKAEKENA